jgi:PhnB protein
MSDINLNPYLFFKGNAREAMEFYKGAFGGELTVQKMGDVPPEGQMPGADPDSVMHAKLTGGLVTLMGSDSPQASDKTAKVELSLTGSDEAQLQTIFDTLAEGGTVRMPLAKQFWGDTFGMLTDKYGVDWMVNIGTNA